MTSDTNDSSNLNRRYGTNLYPWDGQIIQAIVQCLYVVDGLEIVIGKWGSWVILRAIACSCLKRENCLNDSILRFRNFNEWKGKLNEKREKQNGVWDFQIRYFAKCVCVCMWSDYSVCDSNVWIWKVPQHRIILFQFIQNSKSNGHLKEQRTFDKIG